MSVCPLWWLASLGGRRDCACDEHEHDKLVSGRTPAEAWRRR
jgi:hypothetical protein